MLKKKIKFKNNNIILIKTIFENEDISTFPPSVMSLVDCFHISQIGHQSLATNMWNSLFIENITTATFNSLPIENPSDLIFNNVSE